MVKNQKATSTSVNGYSLFSDGHLDMWGYTEAELTSHITFPKELIDYPTSVVSYPYYASTDTNTYWPVARKISKTDAYLVHGRWATNGGLVYETNVAQEWYARGNINTNEQPNDLILCIKY